MNGLEIDPTEASSATQQLASATSDNEAPADAIGSIASAQTEAKWGTESFPDDRRFIDQTRQEDSWVPTMTGSLR
jgi:hypothetical protein